MCCKHSDQVARRTGYFGVGALEMQLGDALNNAAFGLSTKDPNNTIESAGIMHTSTTDALEAVCTEGLTDTDQ
jgi:hypothetical protein